MSKSARKHTSQSGAPRKLRSELLAKQNRVAAAQSRKLLGRHYAAKYRVHKGR